MIRKIIHIDEEKCDGCGLCATACHEGAIEIIEGKARLIGDKYCDGLGDCLPACPMNAIKIIEREAEAYSDEAVEALQKDKAAAVKEDVLPCGCPGTMSQKIDREKPVTAPPNSANINTASVAEAGMPSQLSQWPVQIKLVNPGADYFKGANLLVAADCTAFAYGNFHEDFIKDHTTIIGCPKLDDNEYYKEKLTEIIGRNDIKSLTVVRMEVPCCNGIINAVKAAMLKAGKIVPYREVVVGIDGSIK